jgi:four helix bundle protein
MSSTYEDLKVWQCAMELVFTVYDVTQTFPRDEIYGLTNQIRRASVSIASNIAEGKGRASDKELLQFLNRARGSLYEVQTQLKIAHHLGYMKDSQSEAIVAQAANRSTAEWLNKVLPRNPRA